MLTFSQGFAVFYLSATFGSIYLLLRFGQRPTDHPRLPLYTTGMLFLLYVAGVAFYGFWEWVNPL